MWWFRGVPPGYDHEPARFAVVGVKHGSLLRRNTPHNAYGVPEVRTAVDQR
jgi:hypothetical protein